MAITHKWGALGSKTSLLTSSNLNNLANTARKMSGAVSNDTDLYIYADYRLRLSPSTSNRCAGAYVSLFVLADLGDSTYTFGGSSLTPPANAWVGHFYFDCGATAARVDTIWNAILPPSNFKVLIENNTGRPFSCCTVLEYRRYYLQST